MDDGEDETEVGPWHATRQGGIASQSAPINTRPALTVLIAAALAGPATAMPLWVPAGILIGAAGLLCGHPPSRPDPTSAHPA